MHPNTRMGRAIAWADRLDSGFNPQQDLQERQVQGLAELEQSVNRVATVIMQNGQRSLAAVNGVIRDIEALVTTETVPGTQPNQLQRAQDQASRLEEAVRDRKEAVEGLEESLTKAQEELLQKDKERQVAFKKLQEYIMALRASGGNNAAGIINQLGDRMCSNMAGATNNQ